MKISLTGLVSWARNDLKEIKLKAEEFIDDEDKFKDFLDEVNFDSIRMTIEGLHDIIVTVIRNQESIEAVKDFAFSNEDVGGIKLFESMIRFSRKQELN